jgi:hypothetical protein
LPTEIAVATALISFCQIFGGAILITISNSIFENGLQSKLAEYVPDIPVEKIIAAGATGFRSIVPDADLPGVLQAYSVGVDRVFYVGVAASCVIFVFAWGMGWHDVREKKMAASGEA